MQLNKSPLGKAEAKSLMFKELKGTARASGKIRELNQMVESKPQMFGSFGGMKEKDIFYTKKEKGETVYIQRPKYRISSMGEKREISFKGLATIRNKKTFGGLFK